MQFPKPEHVVYAASNINDREIHCVASITVSRMLVIDRALYPGEIPSAYKGAPLVPAETRHQLRLGLAAFIYAEAVKHIETMAHAIRAESLPSGDRFGAVVAAADALKWVDELRATFIGDKP
jgi:hypothetical protein